MCQKAQVGYVTVRQAEGPGKHRGQVLKAFGVTLGDEIPRLQGLHQCLHDGTPGALAAVKFLPVHVVIGRFAHTLTKVFPHVYILPGSEASILGNRGPNLVVSSLRELPWEIWCPKADLPFKVEARKPESGIFLTDDYAPVDNLLLPIFAERLR